MNQNLETLADFYRERRNAGLRAVDAIQGARYLLNRTQTIEGTIGRTLINRELVRTRIEPDYDTLIEDQMGDMFNPDVCTDIPARRLEREREEYIRNAEGFGFCGIIAEIRKDEDSPWEHVDSCWGFEGWGDYVFEEEKDFLYNALTAWMENGWELAE